jgi:hypothetical protein
VRCRRVAIDLAVGDVRVEGSSRFTATPLNCEPLRPQYVVLGGRKFGDELTVIWEIEFGIQVIRYKDLPRPDTISSSGGLRPAVVCVLIRRRLGGRRRMLLGLGGDRVGGGRRSMGARGGIDRRSIRWRVVGVVLRGRVGVRGRGGGLVRG